MNNAALRELAIAHRYAIWGAIAGFVGAVTHFYVAFAVIPIQLYCAWRLARAAQYSVFQLVLALILMLIPVANVLALVLMSHRTAGVLKQAGLRVGPMGVKSSDLPAPGGAA